VTGPVCLGAAGVGEPLEGEPPLSKVLPATAPALPQARPGRGRHGEDHQTAEKRAAKGSHPHNHNLFRRPTGLADGLALKESALPTASPWDSPQ
jgi:hypothetical protein